jgi:hypothetical protein
MTPSKKPKSKALRRPAIDLAELPGDPWMAPWERREPGPTQLAGFGWGAYRRRRQVPVPPPRPVEPGEITPD